MLTTIVETAEFIGQASFLSNNEIDDLTFHLAQNPKAGDLIQGTGGVRKLRWGSKGKGKRGGGRVIHYYSAKAGCVYILAAFDKSIKINLTKAERNTLKSLVKLL